MVEGRGLVMVERTLANVGVAVGSRGITSYSTVTPSMLIETTQSLLNMALNIIWLVLVESEEICVLISVALDQLSASAGVQADPFQNTQLVASSMEIW